MMLAGNHIIISYIKTKILKSSGLIYRAKRFFNKKNFTQFILCLCINSLVTCIV